VLGDALAAYDDEDEVEDEGEDEGEDDAPEH
jgi:hypothetical protein